MYKVIVLGSGPAGLFAALELESLGVKDILLIDKELYSSGGLKNDVKLNFDSRIGIDLEHPYVEDIIQKIKSVFVEFPKCSQVTCADDVRIKEWEDVAQEHGVEFIAPDQWHIGTNNSKELIEFLLSKLKHTTVLLNTEIKSISVKDGFVYFDDDLVGETAIVAPGRSGAYWFREVAKTLGIETYFGPLNVGIRVECSRKILDPITDVVYDPKFIFKTKRHRDKVRTFCTNPGGRVRIEKYNGFNLVNGDALSDRKTDNTNFALLNTIPLTEPFSDTTEFGRMIALQFHLLGGGKPIVQRVGDFREGKRSRSETFNSSSKHFDVCTSTLFCTAGDISLGLPARVVDNLWESLKLFDKIIPGVLHPSTLLYAPELKFTDIKYVNEGLETTQSRIFVAGDGCGVSRGIVGAAVSGIIAARNIKERCF